MEETPVAPTGGAPASEAPTNSNPAPAEAPAQAAPLQAAIPADRIEAFNRFVENNGGFEKAFETFKSGVSRPQNAMRPNQPHANQQPVRQLDVQANNGQYYNNQQRSPFDIPDGYMTREDVNAKQYYFGLANEEKFAPIKEDIVSGKIFAEMSKLGIRPMENGMYNDRRIRDFLDLYVQTRPATPTTETVTSTPTVDYVNVGEQITSRDDALKIIAQNQKLGGGVAPHPQTEAAKAFLKEYYGKKK